MLIPLLTRLAFLAFSAIQTLLTVRLVMGFVDLPREIMQFQPTVRALTEPLIEPFRGFQGLLGSTGGPGGFLGGGALSGLETAVIVALAGWSVVELVVLGVLRLFRSREDGLGAPRG